MFNIWHHTEESTKHVYRAINFFDANNEKSLLIRSTAGLCSLTNTLNHLMNTLKVIFIAPFDCKCVASEYQLDPIYLLQLKII